MPSTYPSIIPHSIVFQLVANTQAFTSPLNREVQTLELPGAQWRVVLRYNALSNVNARALKGFIETLAGAAGRVYLYDFAQPLPNGVGTGTPKVKTEAAAGAKTMATKGWTATQTGILKAGDMFSVGGELKTVTADCNSDGGGDSTVLFVPAFRAIQAVDSIINAGMQGLGSPTGTFRLLNDQQGEILFRPGIYAEGITLEFVEAF